MTTIAAEWMPHFNRLDSDVQAVKAGERVCRRDIGERLDVMRKADIDAVERFARTPLGATLPSAFWRR